VHRRQSRDQRQPVNLSLIIEDEGIANHINCLRAALELLDSGRDIVRPPEIKCVDFEAELGSRPWTSPTFSIAVGLWPLASTANRLRPGTISRKISSRLPARSGCWFDRPVRLPPGRASEATSPSPTGSDAIGKTMGMTAVAFFAATIAGVDSATMTSTLTRTSSTAIAA